MTYKQKFRATNGYDSNHKCGDCVHCFVYNYGKRNIRKCELLGITSSASTDIRAKDIACMNWKADKTAD